MRVRAEGRGEVSGRVGGRDEVAKCCSRDSSEVRRTGGRDKEIWRQGWGE